MQLNWYLKINLQIQYGKDANSFFLLLLFFKLTCSYFATFFFFKSLFIFRERGREGERKGEKHQYVVASHTPPTGDLACNPGMFPSLGIKLVTLCFAGWRSIY